MDHEHNVTFVRERVFLYCVNPSNCTPEAHNGVSFFYLCPICGATQMVNMNDTHFEVGAWREHEVS